MPCEGAADSQVQLLTSIHRQRFVPVGFSEAVHGVPDVCVGYGTEFGPEHSLIPDNAFIHHWLDGI